MFIFEGKKHMCSLRDIECSTPALPWVAKPGGLCAMEEPSVGLESNEVVWWWCSEWMMVHSAHYCAVLLMKSRTIKKQCYSWELSYESSLLLLHRYKKEKEYAKCTSAHGANRIGFRMCLPELSFSTLSQVVWVLLISSLGKALGIAHQPSLESGQGFLSFEVVTANLCSRSCSVKCTIPDNSPARSHIQMAPFQGLY